LGEFIETKNAILPIDPGDPVEPARDDDACCACASASA
jgi:hypothetical protein